MPDTYSGSDLYFDRLDAVEYAVVIADEFNLSIRDEATEQVKTVR